jgi:ubiquinol-cytochrome c reductase cytochrome b subunit
VGRAVNRYGLPRWLDDRLRGSHFLHRALNKVFPDHWSFMLGEIAMYAFALLVATGIFLTFFYSPSLNEIVYRGAYEPLRGVEMSEAYASVLRLSFEVRAGLVMRQIHHWAALVFVAAILAHLSRVFFTGAFRRPREINWLIGVTLLLLAIYNGFSGYSLPDDLLSGTGLRIAYSIALSIPFAGTWIAFLAFGGEFPAHDILRRLMITHVLIVPAILAGLLALHLAIVWRQKHTQFPGRGRTDTNVVGSRLWPTYTAKSVGLLFGLASILGLMGGLLQINPVWLYGPFDPATVASPAQPDWYLGWLEGALRLFPPWEIRILGHVIANPFYPAVLLPGLTFLIVYAWPWIERRITGDRAEHHVLERPRDNPMRTAVGVAALTFYGLLFLAGSNDIIADLFALPVGGVTWFMRIAVLVLPVIAAILTHRFMWGLKRTDAGSFLEVPFRELVARSGPASGDRRARREERIRR